MSKLTYIQKRFLINRLKMEKLQRNYNREMLKRYDDLANKLYKEINSWIERYADNEGIDVDAAYEILSKEDQKKWSMSLQEFRKKAIEGGYSQELNREYFKSRINRLEHLSNQLYTELVEYAAKEDQHLSDYLKDHYEEAYLRNIYELTDRGSFVVPFDRYSSKQLEQVISKPWLGSNFSKRVWRNLTKKLPNVLEKTMSQAVTLGWGTDKIVNAMMKEVGTFARSRMTTLVQTEAAHIAERATDRSFEETGVKRWEWLATLESHTCSDCGDLDGTPFDLDDKNAPICPLHPNCRCTRIPVVEGFKELHRWQRDPITGKGKIEKNMSFAEWKEKVAEVQKEKVATAKVEPVKNEKSFKYADPDKLQKLSDKWWDNLTQDEQAAIFGYTGGEMKDSEGYDIKFDYRIFNRSLRDQDDFGFGIEKWAVEKMDSGLAKFTLPENTIFRRGMSAKELEDLRNKGYALDYKSLTASEKRAKSFAEMETKGWVVEFRVPKGTQGAFVGNHSKYTKEQEFLLGRNSKLNLISKDDEKRIAIFEVLE